MNVVIYKEKKSAGQASIEIERYDGKRWIHICCMKKNLPNTEYAFLGVGFASGSELYSLP